MTRSNILKLTAFLFVLPFVNIYFNNLVRTPSEPAPTTPFFLNSLVSETQSHKRCFIPHPDTETQIFETPDFGAEMGKYIKDNFGNRENYKIKTVVIDPGHGGRDGGTSGKYLIEKDVALNIAKRLGVNLQYNYPNIRVIYTRSDDRFIPLNERARIANDNNADLFISIHCNSLPNTPINNRVKGSETYVMGLHTAEQNLNVAKRENSSILYEQNYQQAYDGYDPNSPEGHIILSMFQNAYLGQSILLADQIENKMKHYGGRKSLGVKQAGFVVLKLTTMPSVLVETGYLSNSEDEAYLASDEGQSSMAFSILDAFSAYKQTIEDNSIAEQPTASVNTGGAPMQVNSTKMQVSQNVIKTENSSDKDLEEVQRVSKGMAPALLVNDKKMTLSSSETNSNVEYKVLLKTAQRAIDTSKSPWKDINYSVQVLEENNSYRYLVVGFTNKERANKAKEEMRQKGFNEAFVVTYKNGIRVD